MLNRDFGEDQAHVQNGRLLIALFECYQAYTNRLNQHDQVTAHVTDLSTQVALMLVDQDEELDSLVVFVQ